MSGYIGTQPVPQATQHRETFTATASQTTFATVGYTPQFVDVYLNGVHLLDTVDYTATNSSDVVLTTGAAASDVVEIISYTPFEVANQTFTGTTTVDVLTTTGAFTSLGIDDNATSTAITIDASENVGIGVVNPTAELDVAGSGKFSGTVSLPRATTETASIEVGTGRSGNGSALIDLVGDATYTDFGTRLLRTSGGANANSQLVHRGTGELSLNASDAGSITLRTAGLTRLTVDASGNVGIGNVAPDETLEVSGDIKSSGSGFGIYHFGDTSDVTKIVGRDASHASLPNTMGFYTDSAERLRIDASGNLLVGTTTYNAVPPTGQIRNMQWGKTSGGRPQLHINSHAGGGPLLVNSVFADNNNRTIINLYRRGVQVGSITGTNSSTSYNTSSDYRLKKDWLPMAGASERIMALKPVNFAWKVDDTRVDGFLAHELAEVVPEAATGTKDAMRDEEYEVTPATETEEAVKGTRSVPDMQGIDQSKLVPLLTAALQEALTKIEALEVRLTALEVTP